MIEKNIKEASNRSKFNEEVELVVVSKTRTLEEMNEVVEYGYRTFGENKVQQIQEKYKDDYEWHFIGRLQSNKVKPLIDKVCLIHSVDRKKILETINKEAMKQNKVLAVLLQVNVSGEESKTGYTKEELIEQMKDVSKYQHVVVSGLMTMAPFTDDEDVIRDTFRKTRSLYDQLKEEYKEFRYLSMGMSNDYEIAIEEGANLVRIGSSVFK
jgi:pyridoxal phosphate enzyme (YggS family)